MSDGKRHFNKKNEATVPLSLGKPSLRRRLEAYYRLVAPHQLSNTQEWLSKMDQIYDKYGGTHQGEASLARKLAKKYGQLAALEIIPASVDRQQQREKEQAQLKASPSNSTIHDEAWYQEQSGTKRSSGLVDLTSPEMDARAVLDPRNAPYVTQDNPWLASQCSMLERVDLFAAYLPRCDPQKAALLSKHSKTSTVASTLNSTQSTQPSSKKKEFHVPRCFADIAEAVTDPSNVHYSSKKKQKAPPATSSTNSNESDQNNEIGPMSLLWRAMQERFPVRILIRYGKKGLRGTLTGFVAAMDKHWNLVLQDAEEVYSTPKSLEPAKKHSKKHSRQDTDNNDNDDSTSDGDQDDDRSPLERELHRRQCNKNPNKGGSTSRPPQQTHKRRFLSQLLVRGDTIVLVYRATAEESALVHPGLSTRYRKRSAGLPSNVGTPGTCTCVAGNSSGGRGKHGNKRQRHSW